MFFVHLKPPADFGVRKHTMLERALRRFSLYPHKAISIRVRKHTMLERALRRNAYAAACAPVRQVRKHTMLERALRPGERKPRARAIPMCVRKHTMLERALRPMRSFLPPGDTILGQKAYNAREGIETVSIGNTVNQQRAWSESIQCSRGH